MVDLSTIILFAGAAIILLVIPGPAVIYIITRSIAQGRAAGVVSALGISVGTFIHVAATAFGLSAILVASTIAFAIVKYLGAMYLIYLGIRELFRKSEFREESFERNISLKKIFLEGALVNLLNPKTALFMFAFLPQFVKVSTGPVAVQFLIFGCILIFLGLCSDTAYALLSSSIRGWVTKKSSIMNKQKYFTGTVYITLGMITAFSTNGK